MQIYTINSETYLPVKGMDHRHYQGKSIVHSAESCGTMDGPGLRYVLFLQDYLMRCLYCHNRDTWDFHTDKCQEVTVEQTMKQIMFYRHYLETTGGGITVTGGGPLLQYEFVYDWLTACREHGVHTCLNTNSYTLHYDSILEDLPDHTNLVMLDLEQVDLEIHKALVSTPNTKTLNFARHLVERGQSTRVRCVTAPGYTSDERSTYLLGGFTGDMESVGAAGFLPHHELDVHKRALCGDEYRLKSVHPPSKEAMLKTKEILEGHRKSAIY